MSQFDPASFLDATLTAPLEKRPPLPIECPGAENGLYTAIIGEVKSRTWQGKTDPTKSGIVLDVPLVIQVPQQLQEVMKLAPTLTLTDGIMLDLTDAGSIDTAPGKNRVLRNYREAVDMNKVGDAFSPRKMQGLVVKVKISHEMYNGNPVERIAGVF